MQRPHPTSTIKFPAPGLSIARYAVEDHPSASDGVPFQPASKPLGVVPVPIQRGNGSIIRIRNIGIASVLAPLELQETVSVDDRSLKIMSQTNGSASRWRLESSRHGSYRGRLDLHIDQMQRGLVSHS
jgi:hypothetical protein